MSLTTFVKNGDIFNCELKLANGEMFTIPMREDGYIYATALCKASGKRLALWKVNKETNDFFDKVKADIGIPTSALIEIYKGGNNKYLQGTWIHPDLGIHLAQWCNPSFSLQVSRWVRELLVTGKVEQGKEKSSDELKSEYEKKFAELKEQYQKELDEKTKIIMTQGEQNMILSKKYERVYYNHQSFLRKKDLYKLKKGGCVYLAIMRDEDKDIRTKVGMSRDITERISSYRTSNPFCKVLFVLYTEDCVLLETIMKRRYEKELNPNNREFITDVKTEDLIKNMIEIAKITSLNYTIETDQELEIFNDHNVKLTYQTQSHIENADNEDQKSQPLTKRCGGVTHKTEESRFLPYSRFFKNAGNEDGVNRLCKDCYLTGVYGDKRKVMKVVPIPDHDKSTHKWCNLCENVKEHSCFYKARQTKDGLCANCKACKHQQKIANKAKKEKEKENTEKSCDTE
jgi:hypothetical protein